MNLSFRKASPEDAETISRLGHKIWHEHYPSIISVEQINFMLADRYSTVAITNGMQKGEMYFIAFADDVPVAIGCIELKGDHYFLHKFYVDVSNHRRGIGSSFFNFILQHIDAGKPIRLQVNRKNYKAINFYFKTGFVVELVHDFDIGGGFFMEDFVMLRR